MTFTVKCAPVLKQWNCCCCSCSMRAATIILGWFKMLYAISNVIFEIVWLATADEVTNSLPIEDERQKFELGVAKAVAKQVVISFLVVGLLSIFIYGLLLFGIHKKKPGFMLPYIVLQLISFILACIGVVVMGIYVTAAQGAIGLLIFVVGGIILAIVFFLWVVFYSYYRELEDEKNLPQNHEVINYTYNMPSDQEKLADQFNHKPYPA